MSDERSAIPESGGDSEAVGAPPFALDDEDGGSLAVVGHPNPPESIKDSAVPGFDANPALVEQVHPHEKSEDSAKPAKKTTAKKTASSKS